MPYLPPEIWRVILRKPSRPGFLYINHDPFEEWEQSQAYQRAHTASIPTASATRRSLILVSRSWYVLSVEFLYEDIALQSVAQAMALARTVQYGKIVIAGRKVGSWTRRLQLLEVLVETPAVQRALHANIANILRCMPNLEHFFDDGIYGPNQIPLNSNTGPVVMATVTMQYPLTSLHLRGHNIDIDLLCAFLGRLPRLTYLKLVQCKGQRPRSSASATVCLPRLRTLAVDSPDRNSAIMSLIARWTLARLNTLVILGHEVPRVNQILSAHGSRLTTLILNLVGSDRDLGRSLENCSQLQHLIVSLYLEITPSSLLSVGATLVRVGIEDMDELSDGDMRQEFGALYDRLDGLLSTFLGAGFPRLRRVAAMKTTPVQIQTALRW